MQGKGGASKLDPEPVRNGSRVGAAGALDMHGNRGKGAVPLFFEMLAPEAQYLFLPKVPGLMPIASFQFVAPTTPSMYPDFRAAAEKEGEQGALTTIRFAFEAEKIHAKLYARAKDAAASGKDLPIGEIHICSVCGHTTEDGAPDACPVCGAGKGKFRKF